MIWTWTMLLQWLPFHCAWNILQFDMLLAYILQNYTNNIDFVFRSFRTTKIVVLCTSSWSKHGLCCYNDFHRTMLEISFILICYLPIFHTLFFKLDFSPGPFRGRVNNDLKMTFRVKKKNDTLFFCVPHTFFMQYSLGVKIYHENPTELYIPTYAPGLLDICIGFTYKVKYMGFFQCQDKHSILYIKLKVSSLAIYWYHLISCLMWY